MQRIPRGFVFCGVLFLAGCGTLGPSPGSGSVPIEQDPEYTDVSEPATPTLPTTPTQPSRPVSGASLSLMGKADVAVGRGDYEQALALLERAQRIDPDSGEIYLSLARTYTAKGDVPMASAVAERGLLYCSGAAQCGALRAYTH